MSVPAGGSAYHATDGAAYEVFLGRWTRRLAEPLLDFARFPAAGRLLDVGCGTGALAQAMAMRWSTRPVVGTDIAPPYIAFARSHAQQANLQFEIADVVCLPFADASFASACFGTRQRGLIWERPLRGTSCSRDRWRCLKGFPGCLRKPGWTGWLEAPLQFAWTTRTSTTIGGRSAVAKGRWGPTLWALSRTCAAVSKLLLRVPIAPAHPTARAPSPPRPGRCEAKSCEVCNCRKAERGRTRYFAPVTQAARVCQSGSSLCAVLLRLGRTTDLHSWACAPSPGVERSLPCRSFRFSHLLRNRETTKKTSNERLPRALALFRIFSALHRTLLLSYANYGCSRSQPIWTPPSLRSSRSGSSSISPASAKCAIASRDTAASF